MSKPLGRKAYGSIPHLPGSRLGPGDHQIHQGQAEILTGGTRDRYDEVVMQEKLDGSCVALANVDVLLVPMTRSGYPATTSKYEQHLRSRTKPLPGHPNSMGRHRPERLYGEWLAGR